MSFPRYPDYKDSGVEWLGEVPSHWELMRLKRIAAIQYGIGEPPKYHDEGTPLIRATNVDAGNITRDGLVFVDPDDIPANRITWLSPGDIIVVRSGAYTGDSAIIRSEHCPSIAGFDMVLHPDGCIPNFLQYALLSRYLKSHQIDLEKLRAAQPHLNAEELGHCFIVLPPLPEQSVIAAFLDHETGKIDALVAEQEKLIELLKEKRQAVISHAVTKGLDPSVPLKDSGIEWLGEVPAHWQVVPLRALSSVVRGASPRPAGDPRFFLGDFMPWVTVAEITKDDLVDLNETTDFLTEEGVEFSRVFPAGTVIYSNSGATLGVPKILKIDACANDGVVGFLSLSDRVDSGFVYHFLGSLTEIIRDEIRQGSGQPNLNTDIVKAIRMPVPPLDEQLAVVDCIRDVCKRFTRITAESLRAIELLKERRSALISAAVTGKIDVRGLVTPEAAA